MPKKNKKAVTFEGDPEGVSQPAVGTSLLKRALQFLPHLIEEKSIEHATRKVIKRRAAQLWQETYEKPFEQITEFSAGANHDRFVGIMIDFINDSLSTLRGGIFVRPGLCDVFNRQSISNRESMLLAYREVLHSLLKGEDRKIFRSVEELEQLFRDPALSVEYINKQIEGVQKSRRSRTTAYPEPPIRVPLTPQTLPSLRALQQRLEHEGKGGQSTLATR